MSRGTVGYHRKIEGTGFIYGKNGPGQKKHTGRKSAKLNSWSEK